MTTQYLRYATIFKHLLITDLLIYKKIFLSKLSDYYLQLSIAIGITTYVMPAFGLSTNYGVFSFASFMGIIGMWEIYPDVAKFIMDLHGDSHTSYQLTLPLPSWLLWLKTICFFAIRLTALSLLVMPLGKIILWDKLDMCAIAPLKLITMIILANIFYAVFILWAVGRIKHMGLLGKLWTRYLYPLWFLGCFQFSWQVLYDISPWASYFALLNPITYVAEGTRAAIIGQADFLSFWYCAFALMSFTLVFWLVATRKLKQRLDFV